MFRHTFELSFPISRVGNLVWKVTVISNDGPSQAKFPLRIFLKDEVKIVLSKSENIEEKESEFKIEWEKEDVTKL